VAVGEAILKLIIAEKPSVARTIADTLGASARRDGYFEGNGYFVTYAFGHVFTLFDAKDYDPKYSSWSLETLPILPRPMRYKPQEDRGVKAQIAVFKKLAGDPAVSEIINACDSDREGSLIFAEIYEALGVKKPTSRLWVSSHTPEDLAAGFRRIRSGDQDRPLTDAGYGRQWIDWLIGINYTIAATKKFSAGAQSAVLPVGRVILPTLGLIYKREQEIKRFTPRKYFVLSANFKTASGSYVGLLLKDDKGTQFDAAAFPAGVAAAVKGAAAVVTSCNTEKVVEGPGRLLNLTDLQGHITSRFKGWGADKVLRVAQDLYELKHITYPRTASRYLDDSLKESAKKVFEAIKQLPTDVLSRSVSLSWHERKSLFDSSKVDSHPALMPTHILPDMQRLSSDERTVYVEIVRRFAAQFAPEAEYEKTVAVTKAKEFNFITKAKSLIVPGWTSLFDQAEEKEDEQGEDAEAALSFRLSVGLKSTVAAATVEAKETKPPARYTIKTLLAAMQSCGREVEDEKQILKGYTIGTAATRAEAIKKIERAEYVILKGKSFFITQKGSSLIEVFPIREMIEPDFTGRLEKKLKDIELGLSGRDQLMDEARELVAAGVEWIRGTFGEVRKEEKTVGACPVCGRPVNETPRAFTCSAQKAPLNPCSFVLWKEDRWFGSMGKKITATFAKGLIAGRVVKVKGFKSSKTNRVFDAGVKMVRDGERWKFIFDDN